MDLHYSQTIALYTRQATPFHYLMDLHYSQTSVAYDQTNDQFHYLMDLHYSQTTSLYIRQAIRFTTLWIYTILKQAEK